MTAFELVLLTDQSNGLACPMCCNVAVLRWNA